MRVDTRRTEAADSEISQWRSPEDSTRPFALKCIEHSENRTRRKVGKLEAQVGQGWCAKVLDRRKDSDLSVSEPFQGSAQSAAVPIQPPQYRRNRLDRRPRAVPS